MALLLSSSGNALQTTEAGGLFVRSTAKQSVALRVLDYVSTGSSVYSYLIQATDGSVAWTAENADIALSDATVIEEQVVLKKNAALSRISNEAASDNPVALAASAGGLLRDTARKLDAALFATGAQAPLAPIGFNQAAGFNAVDAGAAWVNTDPFDESIANANDNGVTLDSFVTSPATALALAQLKESATSERNLLQPDPTQPTRSLVRGVPLFVSPAVEVDTVWGIASTSTLVIVRNDVDVQTSEHPYFGADALALRSTMRVAYAHRFPVSQSKISLTP